MFKSLNIRSHIATSFAISIMISVIGIVIMQDYLQSLLKQTPFYISESLLFSSFWWFFGPLFLAQHYFLKQEKFNSIPYLTLVFLFPVCFHLLLFPFLVWLMSLLFYYHTYTFKQVLHYTLSEQLYQLLLFYAIPLGWKWFNEMNTTLNRKEIRKDTEALSIDYVVVSAGNSTIKIPVNTILFVSAKSPYVELHLENRKYLYNASLKSMITQLPSNQFVRIHKSTIVNMNMVESYVSRLNGDYDIKLFNKTELRLSRNYTQSFKEIYLSTHPLTAK